MALRAAVVLGVLLLALGALPSGRDDAQAAARAGIHKIRHVVIIMQENRSFDSYFGTYPGADGIPGLGGNPGTIPCLPDPNRHHCIRPYHNTNTTNFGGPHSHPNAKQDINDGQMNGFIVAAEAGKKRSCNEFPYPWCSYHPKRPDVMGYHDGNEIPNYWAYASQFVLQDHMFESDSSWSMPQHLYLVSGWSAKCTE